MPIYTYYCDECQQHYDEMRPTRSRNDVRSCDQKDCSGVKRRGIETPAPMPSSAERPGRGRNP